MIFRHSKYDFLSIPLNEGYHINAFSELSTMWLQINCNGLKNYEDYCLENLDKTIDNDIDPIFKLKSIKG